MRKMDQWRRAPGGVGRGPVTRVHRGGLPHLLDAAWGADTFYGLQVPVAKRNDGESGRNL